jgi:two-component system sensor histidine kinase DctS
VRQQAPLLRLQVRAPAPPADEDGRALARVLGGRPGPRHPEEVAEQLFTPFFTTKAEGMGLGLSLCRTVVEQHGGFLVFEPNRPQGTVFRFTLPAQPVPLIPRRQPALPDLMACNR